MTAKKNKPAGAAKAPAVNNTPAPAGPQESPAAAAGAPGAPAVGQGGPEVLTTGADVQKDGVVFSTGPAPAGQEQQPPAAPNPPPEEGDQPEAPATVFPRESFKAMWPAWTRAKLGLPAKQRQGKALKAAFADFAEAAYGPFPVRFDTPQGELVMVGVVVEEDGRVVVKFDGAEGPSIVPLA